MVVRPGRSRRTYHWDFTDPLPTFFGNQQVVLLATEDNGDPRGAMVYETDDGGSNWRRYPLPSILGADFSPGSLATRFAAVAAFSWRVDVGSRIYETNDAGRTWTTVTPVPKTSLGDAEAVV